MGETRVLFTDATTAEAITVLKSLGYMEASEGGCFKNERSPLRIYSVWGKAMYYPDLLERVEFSPRIQIHFKCKETTPLLDEIVQSCAKGLLKLQGSTKLKIFDANKGNEVFPSS